MNSKLILVILLIGILVFSIVQTFEINNLKKSVGSSEESSYASVSSKASNVYSALRPSTTPTMVGGC